MSVAQKTRPTRQTRAASSRIYGHATPPEPRLSHRQTCRSFRRVINIWGSRGVWYKQTTQHHNAPDALGPHHHLPVKWIYLRCWVRGQMFIITTHSKTNSQSSKKLESHNPYPNSIPSHKSSNLMSDCLTIGQLSSRFTLPIALPFHHLTTAPEDMFQAGCSFHAPNLAHRDETHFPGTSIWLHHNSKLTPLSLNHFGFKRALQWGLV